ncbi:MAG: pyridoxamine 5'-phosphate oxidase family protein [Anaerolineales bacterium]|nr:pyridoxamine 5'-phosphate oxidase family protein [Anaerolineales bacterium]
MAKFYDALTDELVSFIEKQHLFFVASVPLTAEGHVNLSPKGLDCLRILSPNKVAYLDLTGSGNETSAHLAENGRITFMFCSFNGPPRILRLYGRGQAILPHHETWTELAPQFPEYTGTRQIITADIDQVQTSCGFAVPLMDYVSDRETLLRWADTKGRDGVEAYQQENNLYSIDDLPTPLNLNS